MRSPDLLVDEGAAALREATAIPADGRVTRERILIDLRRRHLRRQGLRRLALMLGLPLLVVGSTSAAFTLGSRWHARPGPAAPQPIRALAVRIPSPVLAARPDPAAHPGPAEGGQDEALIYGRAHRLHFVEDSPARALRAWDEYLRRYPAGSFVPEARFNRALSLVRLGERERAAAALQPFAMGRFDGYRRREACLLLERLQSELARSSGCP